MDQEAAKTQMEKKGNPDTMEQRAEVKRKELEEDEGTSTSENLDTMEQRAKVKRKLLEGDEGFIMSENPEIKEQRAEIKRKKLEGDKRINIPVLPSSSLHKFQMLPTSSSFMGLMPSIGGVDDDDARSHTSSVVSLGQFDDDARGEASSVLSILSSHMSPMASIRGVDDDDAQSDNSSVGSVGQFDDDVRGEASSGRQDLFSFFSSNLQTELDNKYDNILQNIEIPDDQKKIDYQSYHMREYLEAERKILNNIFLISGIQAIRIPKIKAHDFRGPQDPNQKENSMRRYFDAQQDFLKELLRLGNDLVNVNAEDFSCFIKQEEMKKHMQEFVDVCKSHSSDSPYEKNYWKKITEIQLKLSGFIKPVVSIKTEDIGWTHTRIRWLFDETAFQAICRNMMINRLELAGFIHPDVDDFSKYTFAITDNSRIHKSPDKVQKYFDALCRRREHHRFLLEINRMSQKQEKTESEKQIERKEKVKGYLGETEKGTLMKFATVEHTTLAVVETKDYSEGARAGTSSTLTADELATMKVIEHKEISRAGTSSAFATDELSTMKATEHKDPVMSEVEQAIENMEKTKIFALNRVELTEELVQHICSKLNPNDVLSKLKLKNCGVEKKMLSILNEKAPTVKVEKLNFSRNKNLDFTVLRELVKKFKCESLTVSMIALNENQADTLGNFHVKQLKMDYVVLPETVFTSFANLLKNDVRELSLIDSNITPKQLVQLESALDKNKKVCLRILDLSHIALGTEGLEAIGKIINKAEECFEKLSMRDCHLNNESFSLFAKTITIEIHDLDISFNENLTNEGMASIIDVTKKVEVLGLSSLSLHAHHIQDLIKSSNVPPSKVVDLDLSENPAIEAADVGRLVRVWKLKRLDISECLFLKEDIEEFVKCMGKHKLDELRNIEISRKHGKKWMEEVKRILENVATTIDFCSN